MGQGNHALAIIAALATVTAALMSTKLTTRWIGLPDSTDRVMTVDGLRGFLGIMVFIHHASLWQTHASTDIWKPSGSVLFMLFGTLSVQLFFMITGFLFFGKLLSDRERGSDFIGLLVSRIMRLTPLYIVMIFFMVITVFAVTGWQLHEPIAVFMLKLMKWSTFTLAGAPDLNGHVGTGLILAGVYWTLPYEWVFYMALPAIAIATGKLPKAPYVIASLLFLLAFCRPSAHYLSFAGGMVAAVIGRRKEVCHWASRREASYVAVVLLLIAGFLRWHPVAILLPLTAFFVLVACGTSLFGLLNLKVSRCLGEYTYGIYLIHGLLLFVFFKLIMGQPSAAKLSSLQFWAVITAGTPLLILVSAASFRYIEKPCIGFTRPLTRRLKGGKGAAPLKTSASNMAVD